MGAATKSCPLGACPGSSGARRRDAADAGGIGGGLAARSGRRGWKAVTRPGSRAGSGPDTPGRAPSARVRGGGHRMGRILAVVVLCALALSGAAFAGEPGFTPVEPASPNAEGIKQSYMWVAIFTGAIFVLVEGTLIWFIVRYRADRRTREMDGAQVHGNTNLELGVDGRPGPDPGRDRVVRLLQAARDREHPRRRPNRGGGRRPPLLLELHLPERRHRGRQAARAGRADDAAGGVGARLRRHPLLVDPGARRQVRRHPGADQRDLVQPGCGPGSTAASAPSSAAPSTR